MNMSKKVGTLTATRLRELLFYDADTGAFTRVVAVGKTKAGDIAGATSRVGYRQIQVDGSLYYAHRLAWLYVTGSWPAWQIDHIDGDRGNNKFSNLRDVSGCLNMQNQRRPRSNNTTGFLGVFESFGRFVAHIGMNGKARHLGSYSTPEQAYAAYLSAKRELHAACTI